MTAPAPAPKRRMVFDGVLLPPPPPAEWLKDAIMFPVSRAKKQKKRRSDYNDVERPPKKKQRMSGARVESPIELDQDEDYVHSDTEDDEPLPLPVKMKKSPTKPQPRRPRKTKEKVVDTTMKTPDELRKAERVAQERVCHQCRNMKKNTTARRVPCGRKNCTFAYCERCLELRYDYTPPSLTSTSPPTGACPSCRGNCNCSVCLTKRGLEDHMPHLRALAKDWDKNKGKKEGAVCPRVWLEREGLLVEEAREVESGRWVVDERYGEMYEERVRREREEMVGSGRRWYVGLPPPPLRRVRGVPSAPSTIDGDDEGERDSLFDGPYTPDAPVPVPVPEERNSLFAGSCTPLTPSEQDRDLALGLEEDNDNDKDSLFDGPFTWDDLDTDSPEDALRVETELALVLGDEDAEASTDPDYVDVVVREGIIGTREREVEKATRLVKKPSASLAEELSRDMGDMSDLSTPTPSLTASASNSTLHAPSKSSSVLKASSSSCTVVTMSSSATATQPAQDDDDEPDEHPDYDCSHLRRPFVSCNPPRIVGLPLRWVPAPASAPAPAAKSKRERKQERVVKRSRAYEEEDEEEEESDSEPFYLLTDGSSAVPRRSAGGGVRRKRVVKRSRAYEEDDSESVYLLTDDGAVPRRGAGGGVRPKRSRAYEEDDSESVYLFTDGSSDDGAVPRRGAGGRRGGKASARTRKREESSSPSTRSPKTPHPYYYTTDTYSYPPDPTPTEPVFVPDEVVDESMRGSKADDVFLLPAPGPVEFGWDDEEGERMVIDVEAVADAWKSLGAIGIGL